MNLRGCGRFKRLTSANRLSWFQVAVLTTTPQSRVGTRYGCASGAGSPIPRKPRAGATLDGPPFLSAIGGKGTQYRQYQNTPVSAGFWQPSRIKNRGRGLGVYFLFVPTPLLAAEML
jgi:hypothetical protein